MRLLKGLGEAFRKGADLQLYGSAGSGYTTHRQRMWQPGSQYAYDVEAGRLYDNGVVLPAINWKNRAIGEARLQIEAIQPDGSWATAKRAQGLASGVSVDDVLAAFEDPNDYYDGLTLFDGIQLSWDVRGHSFLYVREGNGRKPIGFYWVFHDQMRPLADVDNEGGKKLVTRYEYRPHQGGIQYLVPKQVVQLRHGIDPLQPACGLSPLAAELRDVCLDNEVSTWLAGIVRNGATPGVILSPKAGVGPTDITPDQRKRFADLWDSFVGDKRGKALAVPLPVDVTIPTWSPQQMELGKLRDVPMVRIMAALGLDPMVLGFSSEKQTFANKEQAIDDAGKRTILPTITRQARQLTHQTFPLWGIDAKSFRLGWDLEGVSWLMDDVIVRNEASRKAFDSGGIDRFTFLTETGRAATDADKGVYSPKAAPKPDPNDSDENGDGDAAKKAEELKSYAVRRAQGR